MLRGIVLAAAMAVLLGVGCASAAERFGNFVVYPEKADVIGLDGEIDTDIVHEFHQALAVRPHVKVLVLQSRGGYVDQALALAAEIRQLGLSTAIPRSASCYSACTFLFFAGREHVVRGNLGVHHVAQSDAQDGVGVYDGDVRDALARYGATAPVIRAMVSTPPSDLHVFTSHEISSFSINRGSTSCLAAKYASM